MAFKVFYNLLQTQFSAKLRLAQLPGMLGTKVTQNLGKKGGEGSQRPVQEHPIKSLEGMLSGPGPLKVKCGLHLHLDAEL